MVPAMTAQGRTAASTPFRFGSVYFPSGIYPDSWHPDTAGSGFAFKPVMQPLEGFRSQLVTVSNLTAPWGESVHMGASSAFLNGVGPVASREGTGDAFGKIQSKKTLDQYIVDKIGQETPLPSMELGTEDMGTSIGACDGFACTYFNAVSWKTDTSPLPVEINPRVTFERMFGETGTTEERVARLQYKRSVLDSLTQEVARLRGRLGPRDQRVLGEYLDNVREVERRIQQIAKRSETNADVPAAPSGIPESFPEHVALSYDLLHLAWQGDITRVFTFLLGVEASNRGYAFINVPESHHVCSHHGNDPVAMEKYRSEEHTSELQSH